MNKYKVYKGFQKQKEKEVFDRISSLKKKNILSVAFMLTVMSSLDGKNQSNDENPIWVLLAENNISEEEFIEYRDTTFADPKEIDKIKDYVISDFSYEQKLDLFKYLVYTALLDTEIDDSEAALLSKMEELLEISPEEASRLFDEILDKKNSLKIIDNSVENEIKLFSKKQKFAIFFTLILVANSNGITDEENITLKEIADILNFDINEYNESSVSGVDAVNFLQDLSDNQKEAICALIVRVVHSDQSTDGSRSKLYTASNYGGVRFGPGLNKAKYLLLQDICIEYQLPMIFGTKEVLNQAGDYMGLDYELNDNIKYGKEKDISLKAALGDNSPIVGVTEEEKPHEKINTPWRTSRSTGKRPNGLLNI